MLKDVHLKTYYESAFFTISPVKSVSTMSLGVCDFWGKNPHWQSHRDASLPCLPDHSLLHPSWSKAAHVGISAACVAQPDNIE